MKVDVRNEVHAKLGQRQSQRQPRGLHFVPVSLPCVFLRVCLLACLLGWTGRPLSPGPGCFDGGNSNHPGAIHPVSIPGAFFIDGRSTSMVRMVVDRIERTLYGRVRCMSTALRNVSSKIEPYELYLLHSIDKIQPVLRKPLVYMWILCSSTTQHQ